MKLRFTPTVFLPLLLWTAFLSGCATTTLQGRWISTADQNTREGYEKFVKEYPDSEEAGEAKKRVEDLDYAFLATCRIGTQKAFEGFLTSYPSSNYASIARVYVEFLKQTSADDFKSYKQFIDQYPDHPFVALAKVSVPVLWLKETGRKIGVVVNIHELTDKGLLGGGYGDREKKRQGIWEVLKEQMEREGIHAVLLDGLESGKVTGERIEEIVVVNYSEADVQESLPPMYGPYDSLDTFAANFFRREAAKTIADLLYNSHAKDVSIIVQGVNNGAEYYSGLRSLSSLYSSLARANRAEALKAIGNHRGPAAAMVTLKDGGLSEGRKSDQELLRELKGA